MRVADRNKLDKLIKRAGSVLDMELDSVHVVAERRMLSKFYSILYNPSHQRSTCSQRMITAKCSTERFRRSFKPCGHQAVQLLCISAGSFLGNACAIHVHFMWNKGHFLCNANFNSCAIRDFYVPYNLLLLLLLIYC